MVLVVQSLAAVMLVKSDRNKVQKLVHKYQSRDGLIDRGSAYCARNLTTFICVRLSTANTVNAPANE
jgi:hypothetical protein